MADSSEGVCKTGRSTRGRRLRTLLDDEVEADEQFWTQEAFKEVENDNEYEEEKEVEDVFDSDFDDEEPESEEEQEEDEKRQKHKRRPVAKMAAAVSKKMKKKPIEVSKPEEGNSEIPNFEKASKEASELLNLSGSEPDISQEDEQEEEEEEEEGEGKQKRRRNSRKKSEGSDVELDDSPERRKSRRTSVIIKTMERETLKSLQTPRIIRKRKNADDRILSQEEMLLEAAQTEIYNRQSLEDMLAREEEVKKRAVIQKEIFAGPQIRFRSKDGKNTLEFTLVTEVPEEINSKAPPYPKKAVCAVTGLPAKYKDPLTGQPYATLEAFRTLRDRYEQARSWSRSHRM